MAVREFNAVGHYVQWGIGTGGLATVAQGNFTVVAIAKLLNVTNDGSVLDLSNAGASRATYGHDTANMRYLRGSFQEAGGGPVWTTGNDWCLVAWTKASGTTTVRFHKCILSSDTWTHQNSSGTVENDDNTCTFASTRLNNDNDFVFRGRVAAIAVYNSVLNDASIEGLRDSWADWLAASPIAAWRFDQGTPIDDQTAGGADQTTLAGSSEITGDDPPGFSFGEVTAPVTVALWPGPAPGMRGPTAEPRAWTGVPAEIEEIQGTLSVTEDDDTVAASGDNAAFIGTLSVTEQDDSLSASGSVTAFVGTLNVTETDDTLSASGTHTPPSVSGSLSETEEDDTLAASGSHTPPGFTGTVDVTEQDDTLSGSGTHTPPAFTGTVNVTEANDTLSSAGTVAPPAFTGTVNVTEADDTLVASGTFIPPPISGTLSITEQNDTLAGEGFVGTPSYTGTISVTEANDTLASTGTVTPPSFTGTVAVTEANDTLTANGTALPPPITGTLAVTETNDTLAASGVVLTTVIDVQPIAWASVSGQLRAQGGTGRRVLAPGLIRVPVPRRIQA